MKINTQTVNFNADASLIEFLEQRVQKLSLFYDQIIDVDVYLKVENTSVKENKISEIKVHVPKDSVVVKKQCKSFEEAINNAADSAERVLKRRKEKQRLLG